MDVPLAPQRSRNHQDGFQSPSGQISKAAFFRARPFSGQANNRTSVIENDASDAQNATEAQPTSNIALAIASGAQNWPDVSRQVTHNAQLGTMSPPTTQDHSPVAVHQYRAESNSYDTPLPSDLSRTRPARPEVGSQRGVAAYRPPPRNEPSSAMHRSSSKASSRMGQVKQVHTLVRGSGQSSDSHMSGESADLLMSLMAGQAAMDNQNMPISSWDQAEEWKKELSMLSSRLETQIAKHQREQKILTAARTLAKLNVNNKRMSKQTSVSVEVAEQRVTEAEKEMLSLQGREGSMRRALLEHQAGVLAWEMRRLEALNQIAEEKANKYQKEAEEAKELRVVAQRVHQQDKQLKDYSGRVQQLGATLAEISGRERNLLAKMEALELEKKHWQNQSASLVQENDVLRRQSATSEKQDDNSSQARQMLAQALDVSPSFSVAELADAVKQLKLSATHNEKELRVAKEEMREVSMGMENELNRVATDKDAYKARIEELEREIGESKRSMSRSAELEASVKKHLDKINALESENAQMHAALAAAENQAWDRAANSSSNESATRLKALRAEMEAQDVVMEELWTILPTPASRRATGLVDAVTDELNPKVTSPAMECRLEALQGLYSPAPPDQREDYAGVQETVRRVRTLIEDSKVIAERTVRAGKERELFKNNLAKSQRLLEESHARLAAYQRRQVNILELKLVKAKEDGNQTNNPDISVLERRVHDAEAAKNTAERDVARLLKTCQQLREANDVLSQRALGISDEIEREKRKIQSANQEDIDDLRRQLRDVDEEMERVRSREQNQRLQLLDEKLMRKRVTEEKGSNENNADEWGEFLHLPGQKFHDFSKIREEIVRDTEKMTGKNAGISPNPINLRIFSPNVLTLTLVDLPGLTKVPVGDQPRDIERQIKDMLIKYISKPNAIILAVTAANTDLANSDGLKLARDVDPDGTRTIGVLTKVDLMDQGTDVVDILAGRIIPLRLGYVPVVNRGQRDIDQSKSISSALENERNFFENHPSYASKAQYCGTPYLARKLNVILMHHIRATLPDIKSRIAQQLAKYSTELKALGGAMGETNPGSVVLSTITEFCSEFRTTIDGNTNDLSLNELSGGARISFVFHELFNNGVKGIDPFDQVKDGDIRTILYNSSGSTPSLFVGTTAFEVIVKQQIRRLEEPSIKCCQLVYDELIRILGQLLVKTTSFKRYPELRDRFNSVVISFFKESMVPTQKLVSDMVAMQACYVNTTHPDFLNGHKAMQIVQDRLNANKPPEKPIDPKSGKLAPGVLNNGRDLDADFRKEEPSFFGSFFHKDKTPKRKGTPIMEAPPAVIKPVASLNEREIMETEVISKSLLYLKDWSSVKWSFNYAELLIMSYFAVVKREMIDMVPKAITLTLVNFAKENLQRVLLEHLYKPEILEELLKESPDIVARRKECVKMVGALNQAEAM
ncbi:hypothetical protein QFC22_000402 [Naganishia vaughanmartiniae]|uniref:Uncharacterized protein n=1 Tax=Naganishia vaughanmartiniae TaxID=1424756 RepID=A0ACC2XR09_9TREE|nr:hypothetical protein QFC22_000402 [Naganishia vaughanmartiniae]